MKMLPGHPNVIEFYETIDDRSLRKLYIILELASGQSLQDLIDKAPNNRIPPSQVKGYMQQLMQGLAFIHGKNVVHRDIKPSNLLFNSKEVLKITDFGVAEILSRYNKFDEAHHSFGSPAFQPPEIANSDAAYSGMKVDVWAAGVTMYYCLVGRIPFYADNRLELQRLVAAGDFEVPDFIGKEAEDLLRGMLRTDWSQRLSVREVLHHPWLQNIPTSPRSDWVKVEALEPKVLNVVKQILGTVFLLES